MKDSATRIIDHLVNPVTVKVAIHNNGRFATEPFGGRNQLDRPRQAINHGVQMLTLATIALLVRDYDEAIAFYRDRLGFSLIEDAAFGDAKRWVVVAPPAGNGARLLLAKAEGEEQQNAIGKQGGGRVMFFLETDDFAGQYQRMQANGVVFLEAPRHEAYGSVAVFTDLYGNKWDLIEPRR